MEASRGRDFSWCVHCPCSDEACEGQNLLLLSFIARYDDYDLLLLLRGSSSQPQPQLQQEEQGYMGAEGSTLAGAEAALVDGEHNRSRGKVAQRREHAVEFVSAIGAFNAAHGGGDDDEPPPAAAAATTAQPGRIRVAVRKRPLFPHESAKGDFDAVCCARGGVWMHRTMMRADLKHMVLESYDFAFPGGVFSEAHDTDAVFGAAVAPLVTAAASRGGVSTMMCFGQTGSGKTYTTNGLSERVADGIFASLPAGASVGAVCVEVAGAKVRDLLGGGAPVTLLEDGDGVVHAKGAAEVPAADAAALRAVLAEAQAGRAAAATGVHDASSRSHSVCRVVLHDEAGAEYGRVDLVDLAGSEWAADREQHSAERQREGAEINSSLMGLKACMRTAMADGAAAGAGEAAGRMPYRQHALTKLLKDSFSSQDAAADAAAAGGGSESESGHGGGGRTLMLATLSPSSADTEHSLSTLQHVAAIANSAAGGGGPGGSAVAEGVAGEGSGTGTVLETEATKAARQVLTTNVPQAQEMIRAATEALKPQRRGRKAPDIDRLVAQGGLRERQNQDIRYKVSWIGEIGKHKDIGETKVLRNFLKTSNSVMQEITCILTPTVLQKNVKMQIQFLDPRKV